MKWIKTYKVFESEDFNIEEMIKELFLELEDEGFVVKVDGEYSGTIRGYQVYSDDIDSGFKTTTGLRNVFPIPCRIYIENGAAIVFYKNGVLFSDDMTRDKWKAEFGSLENDPRFNI